MTTASAKTAKCCNRGRWTAKKERHERNTKYVVLFAPCVSVCASMFMFIHYISVCVCIPPSLRPDHKLTRDWYGWNEFTGWNLYTHHTHSFAQTMARFCTTRHTMIKKGTTTKKNNRRQKNTQSLQAPSKLRMVWHKDLYYWYSHYRHYTDKRRLVYRICPPHTHTLSLSLCVCTSK